MTEYMSPWEIAAYDSRESQVRTQYKNSLAGTQYQRADYGIDFQRNKDRLGAQFAQSRARLPGGFVSRGLLDSGLYKQGLVDYANQRQQRFGDLQYDYGKNLGRLGLQDTQAGNSYNTGLSSIESERLARRSELASQIRGIQ